MPTLAWEELAEDLRLARHFCDEILIHSLEGCVWQGFLPRLRSFEWADVAGPPDGARAAAALRKSLRVTLWASAHPWLVLGSTAAVVGFTWRPDFYHWVGVRSGAALWPADLQVETGRFAH